MKYIASIILAVLISATLCAQDNTISANSLKLKLKDAKGLVVYIDGKKYDPEIVELLDPDKIESVSVIKGKEAREKYNASEGVILITSKKSEDKLENKNPEDYPMIIVDGKVSSRDEISKLDPNQIESIDVIKGEQAIKKYNAPNGVIVVKTKK